MKVFIIGITGGVGTGLAQALQDRGDTVSGLVRRAEQREELRAAGVDAELGDLAAITSRELAELIDDVNAIVVTAGAGGAGTDSTTAIEGEGVVTAIEATRNIDVDRFGLVSAFAEAWREGDFGAGFGHHVAIKKDDDVALSQRGLCWAILRPPVLPDEPGHGTIALGSPQIQAHPARQGVADTLAALLHEPGITRQTIDVDHGATPIAEAVEANVRTR